MSDRLNELRRQRALLQEHAAWLDAEIATEAAKTQTVGLAGVPAPEREAAPSPTQPPASQDFPANTELAELIAAQKSAPANSASDVKRGCFVAFGLLFALLGLAVYGLYLYSQSLH